MDDTDRTEKKGMVESVGKVIKKITQRKIYKDFDFLGSEEKERIISSEQIKSILPHKGHFRLLDEVLITPQKMIGKVRITEDMCLGHAVFNGKMVFKGSDFLDMAAQLLGVWVAQWPQLRSLFEGKGEICLPVEYGTAIFKRSILPGDLVLMSFEEVWARERTDRILIIGEKFTAKIEGLPEKKNTVSTVSSVKLLALNFQSLVE